MADREQIARVTKLTCDKFGVQFGFTEQEVWMPVVRAILAALEPSVEGWELTPAMVEAGCRAMHEAQGSGDADAPMHSPYQKSWDEPDSVHWKQWIETVTDVHAAMISSAPPVVGGEP